jgi:hypothetical protein
VGGTILNTSDISLSISLVNQTSTSVGSPLYVAISIRNNLSMNVTILLWSGPFAKAMESSPLTITRDGQPVARFGSSFATTTDYVTSDPSQYLLLPPGSTTTSVTDLSTWADLSVRQQRSRQWSFPYGFSCITFNRFFTYHDFY